MGRECLNRGASVRTGQKAPWAGWYEVLNGVARCERATPVFHIRNRLSLHKHQMRGRPAFPGAGRPLIWRLGSAIFILTDIWYPLHPEGIVLLDIKSNMDRLPLNSYKTQANRKVVPRLSEYELDALQQIDLAALEMSKQYPLMIWSIWRISKSTLPFRRRSGSHLLSDRLKIPIATNAERSWWRWGLRKERPWRNSWRRSSLLWSSQLRLEVQLFWICLLPKPEI